MTIPETYFLVVTFSTCWLSQWETKIFKSALIGYCGSINEFAMHGRTEVLGALPQAGAHSGGEFSTLTCKVCTLCDILL